MQKLSLNKISLTSLDKKAINNIKGGEEAWSGRYFECLPPMETQECETNTAMQCFTDTTPRTYEDCTRGCVFGTGV